MSLQAKIRKRLPLTADVSYKRLLKGIKEKRWDIIYKEKEDFEVFGITSALGGATIISALGEGVRYVPFFVRLFPKGKACDILVMAGGCENWHQWDFGRNEKVVKKIVEMCTGKTKTSTS